MNTKRRFSNPLLDTLFQVRGNQRIALLTEPFFGIPSSLFTPFVAIYMAALGMSPFEVGIITTLGSCPRWFPPSLAGWWRTS